MSPDPPSIETVAQLWTPSLEHSLSRSGQRSPELLDCVMVPNYCRNSVRSFCRDGQYLLFESPGTSLGEKRSSQEGTPGQKIPSSLRKARPGDYQFWKE